MKIEKTLSRNDTGETGSHMAGIHIPKGKEILSFFPNLDKRSKNPRVQLLFKDISGNMWPFTFIYYNNHFFGGTRNEYRLTGMTKFISEYNLKAGDRIVFSKYNTNLFINHIKKSVDDSSDTLRLGNTWKIIKM